MTSAELERIADPAAKVVTSLRSIRVLVVGIAVRWFGFTFYNLFLLAFFQSTFGLTYAVAGLYIAAISVVTLPLGLVGGAISDLYGRRRMIVLSLAGQAVAKARNPSSAKKGTDSNSLIIDTTVLVEIFLQPKGSEKLAKIEEHTEKEELNILVVELAELADWCIQNNSPVHERIEAVKKIANIIPLDEQICIQGSKIKHERREKGFLDFGLLDGLILAAARSMNETLLTFDGDFLGEKDCIILNQIQKQTS